MTRLTASLQLRRPIVDLYSRDDSVVGVRSVNDLVKEILEVVCDGPLSQRGDGGEVQLAGVGALVSETQGKKGSRPSAMAPCFIRFPSVFNTAPHPPSQPLLQDGILWVERVVLAGDLAVVLVPLIPELIEALLQRAASAALLVPPRADDRAHVASAARHKGCEA